MLTLSDINPVLEELYPENQIPDHIMRSHHLLMMLTNRTDNGGKYRIINPKTVLPQGRAATFADAQANAAGSQRKEFDVTWKDNYQVFKLDGNTLRDPKGNRVQQIDHVEEEVNGSIENMLSDISHNLFRNYGGARGRRASISTNTITLSDPEDVANFELGMVLRASAADGTSGALRTGESAITAIDRDAGTVTVASAAAITGFADNDYLFVDGDFGAKMSGLDGWFPATAPTGGDNFFGVDRSVDPQRLAGIRYDATSDTIAEAAVNLLARIQRWKKGDKVDLLVINPIQMAVLELALEGRKRVVEVKGKGAFAHLGFEALDVSSVVGGTNVRIISDASCQADVMWALNTGSLRHETVGPQVNILSEDGLRILRGTTSDDYEGRIHSRGNISCDDTSSNGRAALAAAA